jgi:ABC-type sugar transport system ATPase subunit
LIVAQNISKSFFGVYALKNFSLELKDGQVCCLLGENGSGKSTFVKVLSGIFPDYKGEIYINGKLVRLSSPKVARDYGIAAVHQTLDLVPQASIMENIFLGSERKKHKIFIDRQEVKRITKELLSYFNLELDPEKPVAELTTWQKVIVAMAKAISKGCHTLLIDEATTPLSIVEKRLLLSLIRELKEKNYSILFVTHYPEEVFEIGDEVVVLRDGEKVMHAKVSETDLQMIVKAIAGKKADRKYYRQKVEVGKELLILKNVSINHIIKDINLEIRKGEIVYIVGLPDSGKEQLARAIFGLIPIRSGEMYLNGYKYNPKNTNDAVKHGVGFVPGDREAEGIFPIRPILENSYISRINSLTTRNLYINLNKNITEFASMARIIKLVYKSPSEEVRFLSGGNKQKVVLMRSLLTKCKLIVCEQPTAGIDVGSKVEIYSIFNEFTENGGAVLAVTGEAGDATSIADRILIMKEGKIFKEFVGPTDPEQVIRNLIGLG